MTSSAAAQSEPSYSPRICIGNINPGQMYLGFVQSLVDAQSASHRTGRPLDVILKVSGPYLDAERNQVVEGFHNNTEAEVLVFVDSDITYTWEQLTTLADSCTPEHPVVGGVYINPFRHNGIQPVVFSLNDTKDNFTPMTWDQILAADNPDDIGPLRNVGAIGTGFMAIHRSLIDQMIDTWGYPMPWFIENIINGTHMGEDLCFCLRAADMGYPILCHTGVVLPHTKLINFTLDHHIAAEATKSTATQPLSRSIS